MKHRLFVTTAATFFTASAAMGQVVAAEEDKTMGQNWPVEAIHTFFGMEDGDVALLPEDDIRDNWDTLEAEYQGHVRAECTQFMEGVDEEVGAVDHPSPDDVVAAVREGQISAETWEELCELVAEYDDLD